MAYATTRQIKVDCLIGKDHGGKVLVGMTRAEREEYANYLDNILNHIPRNDKDRVALENNARLGVARDIQARRIPPNTRVPSRRQVLKYLKTVYSATQSMPLSIISLFSPGSWTSSGGSFKLAEDSGYDILQLLQESVNKNGKACYFEVGAGYAGFKFEAHKGIAGIVDHFGSSLVMPVAIHFTNLTKWHQSLPKGVTEHPGWVARDLSKLFVQEGIPEIDVFYSQAALYFEPQLEQALSVIWEHSRNGAYLFFNVPDEKASDVETYLLSKNANILLRKALGQNNGTFLVIRKGSESGS